MHTCHAAGKTAVEWRTGVCRVSEGCVYSSAWYRMYLATPYTPVKPLARPPWSGRLIELMEADDLSGVHAAAVLMCRVTLVCEQ